MAVPSRPTHGQQLFSGRYRLGVLLGRGGMAQVFDAFDERLDRPVALKLLHDDMAARPEVRRRFEAEARAAARLSHPNVVTVYDTGDDDGTPWIAMERLPGETLADRMRGEPLPIDWVLRMAGDVLGALSAAHAAAIIHRDIKPGNILIGSDGCAKVADFGIAKSLDVADDTTQIGSVVGTPAYLAPERIDGEVATAQADLYSLGVVLYEALAGEKPFRGTTPVSVAYAVRHSDVRPLHELRPDVPPNIAAAIHRAMRRTPGDRFSSAVEMAAALTGAAGTTATEAADDHTLVLESRGPLVRPERRPRSRLLVALLLLLLVGLMALGMVLAREPEAAGGLDVDIERVAESLDAADGPRHTDAAERMEALATAVESASPSAGDQANALLRDLAAWQAAGELQAGAVARIREVVQRVPGADPTSFAIPTTTTEAVASSEDENDGEKRGKGKRKSGDDD